MRCSRGQTPGMAGSPSWRGSWCSLASPARSGSRCVPSSGSTRPGSRCGIESGTGAARGGAETRRHLLGDARDDRLLRLVLPALGRVHPPVHAGALRRRRLITKTAGVERQLLVVEPVDSHHESIPERADDPITTFNCDAAAGSYGTDTNERNDLVPAIEDLLHPQPV